MSLSIDVVMPTRNISMTGKTQKSLLNNNINDYQIITDKECLGNANVKRNYGARLHKHDFLFFCDDDVILKPGALLRMLEVLVQQPENVGYAYCDFLALNHPCGGTFVHKAGSFDANRMKNGDPYISTMSLMRRSAYEAVGGFDEKIERLQDYDLFLSMLSKGITGVHIPEVLFAADYANSRITKKEGFAEAWGILRKKHNL